MIQRIAHKFPPKNHQLAWAISLLYALAIVLSIAFLAFLITERLVGSPIKFRLPSGTDVRFSPDGQLIATNSYGSRKTGIEQIPLPSLIIFNAESGTQIAELDETPHLVRFSPDGKYVATLRLDHDITFWNTTGWQKIATYSIKISDLVCDMTYSPDGKFLVLAACGGGHSEVQIIDVTTGKLVKQLAQYQGGYTNAAYSPNGQFIMTTYTPAIRGEMVNTTASVISWDAQTLEEIRRFTVPQGIKQLNWSIDNDYFITIGFYEDVHLTYEEQIERAKKVMPINFWDVKTGNLIAQIEPHMSVVRVLCVSRDRRFLILGGEQSVEIWDVTARKQVKELRTGQVRAIDLSVDNTSLAVQSYSQLAVYDIADVLKRAPSATLQN